MKISADQIREIIYESINEINSFFNKDKQLGIKEETVLYGQDSRLDSLGLVNLIVEVEQRLTDKLNLNIDLTDEKALSQNQSPFLTVKSLCDYIYNHQNQQTPE
ncbi:MAG: hypothetical protein HGGPFJEG_01663 [Ignavibacteria bacterium]|nr:hypothetical protein [Ignavibacteria bacterium]